VVDGNAVACSPRAPPALGKIDAGGAADRAGAASDAAAAAKDGEGGAPGAAAASPGSRADGRDEVGGGDAADTAGKPARNCSFVYLAFVRSAIRLCVSLSRSAAVIARIGGGGTVARFG